MSKYLKKVAAIVIASAFAFTPCFAFGDEDAQDQPPEQKVEKVVEKAEPVQKEEPQVEEKAEPVQEEKAEPVVETKVEGASIEAPHNPPEFEEQEPVVQEPEYPFTVTYNFKFRKANGEWTTQTWNVKVTGNTGSSSKAMSYYNRQVVNNHAEVVKVGKITYTYTGQWVSDDGHTYATSDKITVKNSEEKGSRTVNVVAQYTQKSDCSFQFNVIDEHGNNDHSFTDPNGAASSYTFTFKDPTDVEENYEFIHYVNDDGDIKNPGDQFNIDLTKLENDTVVTYYAVYEYHEPVVEPDEEEVNDGPYEYEIPIDFSAEIKALEKNAEREVANEETSEDTPQTGDSAPINFILGLFAIVGLSLLLAAIDKISEYVERK